MRDTFSPGLAQGLIDQVLRRALPASVKGRRRCLIQPARAQQGFLLAARGQRPTSSQPRGSGAAGVLLVGGAWVSGTGGITSPFLLAGIHCPEHQPCPAAAEDPAHRHLQRARLSSCERKGGTVFPARFDRLLTGGYEAWSTGPRSPRAKPPGARLLPFRRFGRGRGFPTASRSEWVSACILKWVLYK